MNEHHHRPSFFWPIILIGAGAILLLRNLGMVPAFSWSSLLRLWPLLLIVFGLDILFGRRTPWFGGVIGLLTVGIVIAILLYGPAFGFNTSSNPLVTETFTTPFEGTQHVQYYIEAADEPVTISAQDDENTLFNAVITHTGTMRYDVIGDAEKKISLSKVTTSDSWLDWDLSFEKRKWDIGLSTQAPAELLFDGGSGAVELDLAGIPLSEFNATFGSGASTVVLPESAEGYQVSVETGSGAMSLTLPERTDIELSLDTGSGAVNVHLPEGAALRIEVMDDGSGSLNLPAGLINVSSGTSGTGTWQASGFDEAEYQVTIRIINRGSGSLNIR
jgi:hypothetical protein